MLASMRWHWRWQWWGGAELRNLSSAQDPSVSLRGARGPAAKAAVGNGASGILDAPATRRLILLRHAKSSWEDPSLRDHDRPLAPRGKRGAKRIAERLADEGWLPDLILCSDSVRTQETLAAMCEAVPSLHDVPVKLLGSYYSVAAMDGVTAMHLQETVVTFADGAAGTVLCMGHNRGWEEAASEFAREEIELKTANGALLESDRKHPDWASAFAHGEWKLAKVLKPEEQ